MGLITTKGSSVGTEKSQEHIFLTIGDRRRHENG